MNVFNLALIGFATLHQVFGRRLPHHRFSSKDSNRELRVREDLADLIATTPQLVSHDTSTTWPNSRHATTQTLEETITECATGFLKLGIVTSQALFLSAITIGVVMVVSVIGHKIRAMYCVYQYNFRDQG